MNPHNIPQDKKHAEIHLTAIKQTLLELMEDFVCKHATQNSIRGEIRNRIDEVNLLLDGADYEYAANLDHMTENQFNGNI